MNHEANPEQLKQLLSGEDGVQSDNGDEVELESKIRFDPDTRQFSMDVTLTAKPGFEIANYGTSIGYRDAGGKGQPGAYHGGRSWGVADGPVIRTGIDITVAGGGKHDGVWMVATFVKTAGGYKTWTKRGTLELG